MRACKHVHSYHARSGGRDLPNPVCVGALQVHEVQDGGDSDGVQVMGSLLKDQRQPQPRAVVAGSILALTKYGYYKTEPLECRLHEVGNCVQCLEHSLAHNRPLIFTA